MKLIIVTSDKTLLNWETLPKKKAAILKALNRTPNVTWTLDIRYQPLKPELNAEHRITQEWYDTISHPLFEEGYHYIYLHFSKRQWRALGLDQGVRGINQRDTDVVGESYGWADENTMRGDTGFNQFIQNVLHEMSHQIRRDLGLKIDLTHTWHDSQKDISGIFSTYDMALWHVEYVEALKTKLSLAEQLLGLLRAQQPYLRPLPHHWGKVTQAWGNQDAETYPRSGVHVGTDFATPEGTPILAPADGIITRSGTTEQLGNWVEVKVGNRYMVALHLRETMKPKAISAGYPVGYVGKTGKIAGIHSHLEWWKVPMNRALLTSASEVAKYTEDITKVIV